MFPFNYEIYKTIVLSVNPRDSCMWFIYIVHVMNYIVSPMLTQPSAPGLTQLGDDAMSFKSIAGVS
jgi:hypothetical protein